MCGCTLRLAINYRSSTDRVRAAASYLAKHVVRKIELRDAAVLCDELRDNHAIERPQPLPAEAQPTIHGGVQALGLELYGVKVTSRVGRIAGSSRP